MFSKLINHIKGHKKSYGIGFVVVLFAVAAMLFGSGQLDSITGKLTGAIVDAPAKKVISAPRGVINVPVAPEPTCVGSNSNGGDGSYSACVGNTIAHQPTGVLATVLSFDDSKVVLSIKNTSTNAPPFNITVYKNAPASHVGGFVITNNISELLYTYGGSYPAGAYITISSSRTAAAPSRLR